MPINAMISIGLERDYEKALKVLNTMQFPMNLKKAMLHLKLNDYIKAEQFLLKAKEDGSDSGKGSQERRG